MMFMISRLKRTSFEKVLHASEGVLEIGVKPVEVLLRSEISL